MTTVDVPEAEFVVNQATFYLAFLITLGSVGAIIAQVVKGINNRIKHNREEAEAKVKQADDALRKYIDDRMKEVDDVKERMNYIYWKLVDTWFDDRNVGRHGKSD